MCSWNLRYFPHIVDKYSKTESCIRSCDVSTGHEQGTQNKIDDLKEDINGHNEEDKTTESRNDSGQLCDEIDRTEEHSTNTESNVTHNQHGDQLIPTLGKLSLQIGDSGTTRVVPPQNVLNVSSSNTREHNEHQIPVQKASLDKSPNIPEECPNDINHIDNQKNNDEEDGQMFKSSPPHNHGGLYNSLHELPLTCLSSYKR